MVAYVVPVEVAVLAQVAQVEVSGPTEIVVQLEVAVPAQNVPAEVVPAEVVPAEVVPAEVVPAEVVPAEVVPAEVVPAEVVPAEVVPAEVVPAEVAVLHFLHHLKEWVGFLAEFSSSYHI